MGKRRDNIHETPDVTHIHNPEVAHEASDVNVPLIVKFTAGLLIGLIFTAVLMKGTYYMLDRRQQKQEMKSQPGPMALSEQERLPPEPRLQSAPGFGVTLANGERKNLELGAPQDEFKVLSQEWAKQLREGTKDPQTGKQISLPIGDAIKKLVQEGLPTRQTPEAAQAMEQSMKIPSFSSSGRTLETRR
jgi:hypothetical protein